MSAAVKTWQEHLQQEHPRSEPDYWPDDLKAKYMAMEIADLRAAILAPVQAQGASLPPGWTVERTDADAVVKKDGVGGYLAERDSSDIASAILFHFASDVLANSGAQSTKNGPQTRMDAQSEAVIDRANLALTDAAWVIVNDAMDSAIVHICDRDNAEVKIAACSTEIRALYRALLAQAQPASADDARDAARWHYVRSKIDFRPLMVGNLPLDESVDAAIDAARSAKPAALTHCAANLDGDCSHPQCPQLRDGEPAATGRGFPMPDRSDE